MNDEASLDRLRDAFPWPRERPEARAVDWGLEAGGKQLVVDQIRRRDASIVLEIGVFLGSSARVWLNASAKVIVIALDPWVGGDWIGRYARHKGQPEWVVEQLTRDEEAFHQTFLATMWEHRDRVIVVRGEALVMLDEIARTGVRPDVVYLDADKSGRELEVCRTLFPRALLTGDDWFCGIDRFFRPDEGYPIRKPVKEFCRRHGQHLLVNKATWVVTPEPPSLEYHVLTGSRYRMKSIRRRVRGALRRVLGLDKDSKYYHLAKGRNTGAGSRT